GRGPGEGTAVGVRGAAAQARQGHRRQAVPPEAAGRRGRGHIRPGSDPFARHREPRGARGRAVRAGALHRRDFLHARRRTRSLAGATIAAATLPGMLSGPVIGAWLDRTGRRSLIYKVDRLLLGAVLLAILAAAGHTANFVVPLLAFITGLTLPVTVTGFTSMIPLIVEEEILPSANAVEAASLNVALIGGPALAGIVAAGAGPPAAIVVEVALTLVALVLI